VRQMSKVRREGKERDEKRFSVIKMPLLFTFYALFFSSLSRREEPLFPPRAFFRTILRCRLSCLACGFAKDVKDEHLVLPVHDADALSLAAALSAAVDGEEDTERQLLKGGQNQHAIVR